MEICLAYLQKLHLFHTFSLLLIRNSVYMICVNFTPICSTFSLLSSIYTLSLSIQRQIRFFVCFFNIFFGFHYPHQINILVYLYQMNVAFNMEICKTCYGTDIGTHFAFLVRLFFRVAITDDLIKNRMHTGYFGY